MEYRLTTPCTAQDLAPLKAGDTVLLSGVVYTARDQAHKRMIEALGTGIGVVIDGCPSGVAYDEAFVLREMERRAPGRNKQSTARKEPDRPEIQSGIYNGKTTGTPICAVIRNTNQRSNDYAELAAQPRTTRVSCATIPATTRAAAAISPAD